MKRILHMEESLVNMVEQQMEHLDCVDTKELGEAIDMIKDLAETIYYRTITEAMHENKEWKEEPYRHKTEGHEYGKMYYGDNEQWDAHKEGKSPKSRKAYLDAKEKHHDKTVQLRELEKYMQELTQDVVDMIGDSTQEENQYLEKRLISLANKIGQMNG